MTKGCQPFGGGSLLRPAMAIVRRWGGGGNKDFASEKVLLRAGRWGSSSIFALQKVLLRVERCGAQQGLCVGESSVEGGEGGSFAKDAIFLSVAQHR